MSAVQIFPRTLRIGILVFNHFEPLDVWGFVQAFAILRFIGTGYDSPPSYPFEIVLISNAEKSSGVGAQPAPVKNYNGPCVASVAELCGIFILDQA